MADNIYNRKDWVDKFIFEKSRDHFDDERVSKIIAAIPRDVKTVLDVGVGGGSVFRELKNSPRLECSGIDISRELVDRLKDDRVKVGDVRRIPFNDEEFDLVLAGDILEHIEDGYFEKSVSEIARVSKKYILISSPYKDEIDWPVSMCGSCKREFNVYGHVRSIDMKLVKSVFPQGKFDFLKVGFLGKMRDPRPRALVYMARRWGKVYSQEGAVCPHCFSNHICEPRRGVLEKTLGRSVAAIFYLMDNFMPSIFKKRSEILILLKKKDRSQREGHAA